MGTPAATWRRGYPTSGCPRFSEAGEPQALVIPTEPGSDELRRAVVTPGRYRLDPVYDHHRIIQDADAACVVVCQSQRTALEPAFRAFRPGVRGQARPAPVRRRRRRGVRDRVDPLAPLVGDDYA